MASSMFRELMLATFILSAGVAMDAAPAESVGVTTIQLSKQHLPVTRNNVTVAHKTAYYGQIMLGEPRQSFTVIFDTGSGHIILPAAACTSPTCLSKRRFDTATSESATDIQHDGTPLKPDAARRDQLSITFGTGQVKGQFVHDTVCLGQGEESCVGMRMVLATDMTEDPFRAFSFDGVLGLGLGGLSLKPEFNFFGSLAKAHELPKPQFSVFLNARDGGPSEVSFGGHSEAHLSSPLSWTPVADPERGYWQVRLRGVRLGDEPLALCSTGDCRAIIDTGSSLLGVPRTELRAAHRRLARVLPEDHDDSMNCRQFPGPDVVFELDGFEIRLTAEDYSRAAPASMLVAGAAPGHRRDFCRASLLPVDLKPPLGPNIFVWGEPVLRRFYTVYDWGERRIGFGLAKQPLGPSVDGAEEFKV